MFTLGRHLRSTPLSELRQPNQPLAEPPHPQPGSPQLIEASTVARMGSALRDLPVDYLPIDWRRVLAYYAAELTDAEIEAPGRDAAALRSEYLRRNGMIALDSCAAAAGRGARDAQNCVPWGACPYDDPILASEWRRGYRDFVSIVGERDEARRMPAAAE